MTQIKVKFIRLTDIRSHMDLYVRSDLIAAVYPFDTMTAVLILGCDPLGIVESVAEVMGRLQEQ